MNKYLLIIFFIYVNAYADQYSLEYNPKFTTCEGILKRLINLWF